MLDNYFGMFPWNLYFLIKLRRFYYTRKTKSFRKIKLLNCHIKKILKMSNMVWLNTELKQAHVHLSIYTKFEVNISNWSSFINIFVRKIHEALSQQCPYNGLLKRAYTKASTGLTIPKVESWIDTFSHVVVG